jgi:hypothetical protein
MRYVLLAVCLCVLGAGATLADDIVTMPTANQLKAGEVDAAAYYIDLDLPAGAPRFVQYQTLYWGVTDWLEVDLHRARVDRDETSVVGVVTLKALSETPTQPDVVVGVRNVAGVATTRNPALREKSKDRSFFLSAAKTFFLNPQQPGPPLVRAHLSAGTADWTLLGEKRHEGVFGGLQFLFHPMVGGVVQYDGNDWIAGITVMPKNTGLTLKGGVYGDHTWFGLSYRRSL